MSLFTKIINGDIPSSKVFDGDKVYAFLDINPRREGHTLVVPKEEKQRIAELSVESRAALMEGVVEVQKRLTAVFGTTDFQVSVHDGPMAGQEVPHVHVHVIPRTDGDGGKSMLAMWPSAPPIGSVPPDVRADALTSARAIAPILRRLSLSFAVLQLIARHSLVRVYSIFICSLPRSESCRRSCRRACNEVSRIMMLPTRN